MPTLQETLEYLDPEFAKAPDEIKKQVIESIKGDPAKIDKVLSYLDPEFAKAPRSAKAQIIASLSDVSLPEKLWRAFAAGAGEAVQDIGSIIKGGVKLLEKGAEAITGKDYNFQAPFAEDLIRLGEETKQYWTPPEYEEVYDFTGKGIVEEAPSLIAFSPAMKLTALAGKGAAKLIPKLGEKALTQAIAENVGAGAGYSLSQLASGDYTPEEALRQAGLDTALGAGGYAVGKLLSKVKLGRGKAGELPPAEEVKAEEPTPPLETKPEPQPMVGQAGKGTVELPPLSLREGYEILKLSKKRPLNLILFHGTNIDKITGYKNYQGIYLTSSPEYAKLFGKNVLKAKVTLKNPLIVEQPNEFGWEGAFTFKDGIKFFRNLTKKDIQELQKEGYDGIIVLAKEKPPSKAGELLKSNPIEVVVFDNKQITTLSSTTTKSTEAKPQLIEELPKKTIEEKKMGNLMKVGEELRVKGAPPLKQQAREILEMQEALGIKRVGEPPPEPEFPKDLSIEEIKDLLDKIKDEFTFVERFKKTRYYQAPKIWSTKDKLRIYVPRNAYEQAGYVAFRKEDLGRDAERAMEYKGMYIVPTRPGNRSSLEAFIDRLEEVRAARKAESAKEAEDIISGGLGESAKFYSGAPATEQIAQAVKKTLETPEDPLKAVRSAVDESVREAARLAELRRVALKSRLSWILPQYEWMKDHPLTASIYRAAELYTEGMEKDLSRWFTKLEDLGLENIDPRWRNRIADVVEKKINPDKVPQKIREKAKQIRQLLDEAYEWAKSRGLDISYRKDYFPHLFEGNIRVQVGNEFRQAGSWDEALSIAAEGIRGDKKVKIRAFLRPDIYELKITNPRFWNLVRKLEDGVELTTDEIKEVIRQAGIGRRPRWRFVGNLLERKYDIEGYIKDPETALKLYLFTITKKIHQDRFLKAFEKAYEQIPDTQLRAVLDDYKGAILGYPTKGEEFTADVINYVLKLPLGRKILALLGKNIGKEITPFQVRKGTGALGYYMNYLPDLGFSLSSAFVNSLQVVQNVLPLLGRAGIKGGTRYAKGLLKRNKRILDELYEMGIMTEVGFEGLRAFKKPSLKRIPEIPMTTFTAVELFNRATTYGAAKEFGMKHGAKGMERVLKLLGVSENDPLLKVISDSSVPLEQRVSAFAREVVNKTQFRYEKYAAPKLLRSGWAKVALPYKNFLINQLVLSMRMLKNAPKDPKTALQFYGVALLLGGATAGNPVLAGAWEALKTIYREKYGEDLEEKLQGWGKIGEVMVKGVPASYGFDIRTSVKLDVPNIAKPETWLGRPLRNIYLFARDQKERALEDFKPRIYRNIDDALEMIRTGQLKDKKGRVIGSAGWKDALLRLTGFRPAEFYEFVKKKELIYKTEKEFREKYEPLLNELTDAVVGNDTPTQREAIQKILDELDRLEEKIQNSEGVAKKQYLYLYMKLAGGLKNIGRRVKSRTVPFSTDRKKLMLTR